MIQPADILVSLRDSELKLRQISKAGNPRLHERESLELLNRLRKGYRALIVQHVDFLYGIAEQRQEGGDGEVTAKVQRDIPGALWKTCFYAQIAEFRSALKKHTSRLALLSAGTAGQAMERPEEERRERLYVAQLTEAFLKFLSDSLAFYQKMISELEERARVGEEMSALTRRAVVNSVHRCLLYLGDLARYKEMYAERIPKDFSEALRYYERAALIEPASGNAQNQLAVLATYGDAPVVAAYHYCRSILARAPFSGGFENLAQLLDKNTADFHRLPAASAAGRSVSSAGLRGGRRAKGADAEEFLVRFLHLHGLLFEWSAAMHQSYAQLISSSAPAPSAESGGCARPHWLPHLNLSARSQQSGTQHISGSGRHPAEHDGFALLMRAALDGFEELIGAGNLSDVLLVQLLAISLFSVHFAVGREASMLGCAADLSSRAELDKYAQTHAEHPHTTVECLALMALFGLITRAAVRVEAAMSSGDRERRARMNKTLPMLHIFGAWAQLHPHYLSARPAVSARSERTGGDMTGLTAVEPADDVIAPPSMFQDSASSCTPQLPGSASSQDWENTYLASVDSERVEVRARSALRAALASLRSVLEADAATGHTGPQSGGGGTYPLREHIELRGFTPVAPAVEASFYHFDPLQRSVTPMAEDRARHIRLASLVASIGAICASHGVAESNVDRRPVARGTGRNSERSNKAQRRAEREQTQEDDIVPRPPPPPTTRGPPAVAEYLAVSGATAMGLPPSAVDFPALPVKARCDPALSAVHHAEETGTATGTGTQVDSQADFDQDDLGETVVFKSAFVRSHQNPSGTSLASAPCSTSDQPKDGVTDLAFLQAATAPPAEPQDDFFARLSLPALADLPAPEPGYPGLRSGLAGFEGLGGLWGLGAAGGADSWAIGQDYRESAGAFAAPPLCAQPALNFDIFSYLDVDGTAGTADSEQWPQGGLDQTNSAGSAGTGLLSRWNARSDARMDVPRGQFALSGPPGLTTAHMTGNVSATVSAHGSSGSLGDQTLSSPGAKSRVAMPPPGLG